MDEKRERQPDDESRVGRFGWPEGSRLRYYDEDGNRISKEEWREFGKRKAEKEMKERRSKMEPDTMVKCVDEPVGIPPRRNEEGMSTATPEQVLESIVTGINSGNLDGLMQLYESEAAFATQPGSLARGAPGVRESLTGFISMKGKLDLEVTRVLEVGDLALVIGVWTFEGTGPDDEPVHLAAKNADVLRRQEDGSWRFVIDNPWGTD